MVNGLSQSLRDAVLRHLHFCIIASERVDLVHDDLQVTVREQLWINFALSFPNVLCALTGVFGMWEIIDFCCVPNNLVYMQAFAERVARREQVFLFDYNPMQNFTCSRKMNI